MRPYGWPASLEEQREGLYLSSSLGFPRAISHFVLKENQAAWLFKYTVLPLQEGLGGVLND